VRQGNFVSLPAERATHPDPRVARFVARTLGADPPRARSLVVTLWGDSLAPHGGAIWLKALARLLAPFGVNDRLTRTSVFRLARDGWIAAQAHGRQSRYCLTRTGRERFEAAYRRIYAPPADAWSGEWEMVVDPAGATDLHARRRLREDLRWNGFAVLAPGCYVRPRLAGPAAPALLDHASHAVVLAASQSPESPGSLFESVAGSWDREGVARGYRRFVRAFERALARFHGRDPRTLDPEQCFVVRTLLVHAYRRVLLRDPRLPASLLPGDWPGGRAYALTREFYRATRAGAEAHLARVFAECDDALPPADDAFDARFPAP
jgi:phenylacetic acid degradation operon negative regulatory protein